MNTRKKKKTMLHQQPHPTPSSNLAQEDAECSTTLAQLVNSPVT